MILGIGNDLVDIRRIEAALNRHGERFEQRCFTPVERAKAESRREAGTHIDTYAKRFAAKESVAKALNTGLAKGVGWRDVEVINDKDGRPYIKLYGGALSQLAKITPAGMTATIHLSLTDEPPFAQAYVIIEAS